VAQQFCTGVAVGAGAGFLLWELSTPFVHLRWLLHKSGRDKQRIYAVNGLLMAMVFFLCRPAWGTWLSYKVRGCIAAVCRHVLGLTLRLKNSPWYPV
jgi:hypothetical protein